MPPSPFLLLLLVLFPPATTTQTVSAARPPNTNTTTTPTSSHPYVSTTSPSTGSNTKPPTDTPTPPTTVFSQNRARITDAISCFRQGKNGVNCEYEPQLVQYDGYLSVCNPTETFLGLDQEVISPCSSWSNTTCKFDFTLQCTNITQRKSCTDTLRFDLFKRIQSLVNDGAPDVGIILKRSEKCATYRFSVDCNADPQCLWSPSDLTPASNISTVQVDQASRAPTASNNQNEIQVMRILGKYSPDGLLTGSSASPTSPPPSGNNKVPFAPSLSTSGSGSDPYEQLTSAPTIPSILRVPDIQVVRIVAPITNALNNEPTSTASLYITTRVNDDGTITSGNFTLKYLPTNKITLPIPFNADAVTISQQLVYIGLTNITAVMTVPGVDVLGRKSWRVSAPLRDVMTYGQSLRMANSSLASGRWTGVGDQVLVTFPRRNTQLILLTSNDTMWSEWPPIERDCVPTTANDPTTSPTTRRQGGGRRQRRRLRQLKAITQFPTLRPTSTSPTTIIPTRIPTLSSLSVAPTTRTPTASVVPTVLPTKSPTTLSPTTMAPSFSPVLNCTTRSPGMPPSFQIKRGRNWNTPPLQGFFRLTFTHPGCIEEDQSDRVTQNCARGWKQGNSFSFNVLFNATAADFQKAFVDASSNGAVTNRMVDFVSVESLNSTGTELDDLEKRLGLQAGVIVAGWRVTFTTELDELERAEILLNPDQCWQLGACVPMWLLTDAQLSGVTTSAAAGAAASVTNPLPSSTQTGKGPVAPPTANDSATASPSQAPTPSPNFHLSVRVEMEQCAPVVHGDWDGMTAFLPGGALPSTFLVSGNASDILVALNPSFHVINTAKTADMPISAVQMVPGDYIRVMGTYYEVMEIFTNQSAFSATSATSAPSSFISTTAPASKGTTTSAPSSYPSHAPTNVNQTLVVFIRLDRPFVDPYPLFSAQDQLRQVLGLRAYLSVRRTPRVPYIPYNAASSLLVTSFSDVGWTDGDMVQMAISNFSEYSWTISSPQTYMDGDFPLMSLIGDVSRLWPQVGALTPFGTQVEIVKQQEGYSSPSGTFRLAFAGYGQTEADYAWVLNDPTTAIVNQDPTRSGVIYSSNGAASVSYSRAFRVEDPPTAQELQDGLLAMPNVARNGGVNVTNPSYGEYHIRWSTSSPDLFKFVHDAAPRVLTADVPQVMVLADDTIFGTEAAVMVTTLQQGRGPLYVGAIDNSVIEEAVDNLRSPCTSNPTLRNNDLRRLGASVTELNTLDQSAITCASATTMAQCTGKDAIVNGCAWRGSDGPMLVSPSPGVSRDFLESLWWAGSFGIDGSIDPSRFYDNDFLQGIALYYGPISVTQSTNCTLSVLNSYYGLLQILTPYFDLKAANDNSSQQDIGGGGGGNSNLTDYRTLATLINRFQRCDGNPVASYIANIPIFTDVWFWIVTFTSYTCMLAYGASGAFVAYRMDTFRLVGFRVRDAFVGLVITGLSILLGGLMGFVIAAVPAALLTQMYASIPVKINSDLAISLGVSQGLVIVYFDMGRSIGETERWFRAIVEKSGGSSAAAGTPGGNNVPHVVGNRW